MMNFNVFLIGFYVLMFGLAFWKPAPTRTSSRWARRNGHPAAQPGAGFNPSDR
jgi:hypothetical protein